MRCDAVRRSQCHLSRLCVNGVHVQIDANGAVCPKVVYEVGEGGALSSTTPAQFEAQVAQSSAKKWRHSFKAAGEL